MKKFNYSIGEYGEFLACKFLVNNNYKIISRNFRNRFGEIDIICINNNILSFVEVKSRYSTSFGVPKTSITKKKIKNIILLSKYFLLKRSFSDCYIRFDVIEIFFNNFDNSYKINFIKDAFRLN